MAKLHAPDAKPTKTRSVPEVKPSMPTHDGKPKAAEKAAVEAQPADSAPRRGPQKRLRPADETTGCKITGVS